VPDASTALEGAKALGYAGIGALVLKASEFLLKTFGVVHRSHTNELQATLEAAAQMREELRKDNEELRRRMREMEGRLAKLEAEHHELSQVNDRLREENADLRAQVRVADARERGRMIP
jgi:predicted nuclease with TOPRIM domain